MATSQNSKSSAKKKAAARKKARTKKLIILALEVLVLIVVIAILLWWVISGKANTGNKIDKQPEQTTQTFESPQIVLEMNEIDEATTEVIEEYTNIAFFGVDNRSVGNYSSGNSDTIMICSINNETKEVKLVSIFRDTYMDIGRGSFTKCNAAYAYGGPEQAVAMLNKNLDMNITEYVTVDFNALVDVVDALGGLTFNITEEEAKYMNASYIDEVSKVSGTKSSHVSSGYQTLDGVQTTAYCRIRYTSGMDFERAYRQRMVLQLIIDKAKTASPSTLTSIINTVFGEISTSFTSSEILAMATDIAQYDIVGDKGWPFDKTTGYVGEKSMVIACDHATNVAKLYDYLYDMPDYQPSEAVNAISSQIKSDTGVTAANAQDYEY